MSGNSTQPNSTPVSPACSAAPSVETKRGLAIKEKSQHTGRQGKPHHDQSKPFRERPNSNNKAQRKKNPNPSSSKPQRPLLARSSDIEDAQLSSLVGKKGRGNLNHLLQFTLPPRQPHAHSASHRSRYSRSKLVPFNKYRYMNANFRFLVRSTGSYLLQMTDPDDYVDWVDVQQVVVTTTEELSCPICLSAPTAPRMTACGHVYCFPCVLRYLSQDSETETRGWRKCPICYDPVYPKALKPVVAYHAPAPPKPPCSLNFRLLYYRQGSTVTLPTLEGLSLGELPWDNTPGALTFTGLARSTARHMADHLKTDKAALNEALSEAQRDKEFEEVKFIQAAQTEVASSLSAIPKDQTVLPSLQEEDPRELHQFYRSEDGQHLYLHPLHSRILFQHLQEEGHIPSTITLPITHYEESTINEEMRKRFKNLSFLPLGCDVAFVDLNLESFVKPEILQNYKVPLEARARHLKAKIRAERKAEQRVHTNSFSSLEPLGEDPIITMDAEDFPEIPTCPAPLAPASAESSNWAAMASRTRDSHSGWSLNSSSIEQYYAPRPNRTLADDFELALSESIFALDSLDVKGSKGSKKGKKKLVLLSNAQRRR